MKLRRRNVPPEYDYYESAAGDSRANPGPVKQDFSEYVAPPADPASVGPFSPVVGHPGYFYNPTARPGSIAPSMVSNVEANPAPSTAPSKVSNVEANPAPSTLSHVVAAGEEYFAPSKVSDVEAVSAPSTISHVAATGTPPFRATIPFPISTLEAISEPSNVSEPSLADADDFHDGLETQGFIYEQPTDKYWKDKNHLDGLGAFNHKRWNTMRCIHFILPNLNDHGQAATPKQASVPHYQTTQAQIQLEIDSFRAAGGEIEFKCYSPDRNYSNDFLNIVNLGVPEMERIDWDALARLAFKESKSDKKRQHKYKDFGTTGGQCTTRVGSESGVAEPARKPGTQDVCIVEAMLALSEYTKNAEYQWLPKGMRPFNCDDPDDPRNKFAQRFHKDCCIPASRVGLTNLENPCGYHVDEMNSSLPQYELVPTFSRKVMVEGTRFRCALIGYSRRSVDEHLVRKDVHGNYVDFVCNEYATFEDERKYLSPDLFSLGEPVMDCIPRFSVVKNPCNLDPWGHYSSVLESTLQLDRKFRLSLPERLSLLRAMGVTPNSSYLYVAAASSLLQQPRAINPKHRKGYRFGLLVANVMRDIHSSLEKEKRQLPPRRFNCYAKYHVPDEREWNHECDRLLLLHLTTPDTKLKSERQTAYKEVRHSLAAIFPYVDVLGGNHLVAIAGTLGLLPLWVTTEIEIHKGRSLNWLLAKFFDDKKERSLIKSDDVISNIMAALKTRYAGEFSRRTVENIVCKVFRRHTKNLSDGLFYDVLIPNQNLYSVHKNQVRIMSADGKSTCKQRAPLLNMIPFGGSYITLKELRTHLPTNWPSWEPSVAGLGRPFLDRLFDLRRDAYPDLPFEVKTKVTKNRWLLDKFGVTETRLLS
jgi:hypothetical protein